MLKKTFEKPKTGIFYLVPDNRNNLGKYSIYYQLDEETENPDFNLHLELWENKITKLLEIRFKNATINFDDYGGLPRGRVVERGNEWIIAWGNNFSKETYEKDILYEFNLRDANGQGKVKWEIDSHEVFDKISKDNIESSLGIKLTPEGFETIPTKTKKIVKTTPKKKTPIKKLKSEKLINEILKESSVDYRENKKI